MARTGDIKDFVITEESGIAKGIRRIVAVTGHEAADVTRTADGLEAKLRQIEHTSGKQKDTSLKAYTVVWTILYGSFPLVANVALVVSRNWIAQTYLSFASLT